MDVTYTQNIPSNNKIHTLSNAHRTFSKVDHMISQKKILSKFKKNQIHQELKVLSTFSDRNSVKIKISSRRKNTKLPNLGKLNNTFLNNEYIRKEIFKILKQVKMEIQHKKFVVCSKSISKRELYRDKCLC